MLICDLVLEVRASRSLSAAQVSGLKRELANGFDQHDLDLLLLLNRYAERADPTWPTLLSAILTAATSGDEETHRHAA